MKRLFTYTIIFATAFLPGAGLSVPFQKSVTPKPGDSLCVAFNTLTIKIRDGKIVKKEALKQLQLLLPQIAAYYYKHGGKDFPVAQHVFPLVGYDFHAVGGTNGNGYIAKGYDYFDGNKHGGHPADDIFIHDKNQDGIDDNSHKVVNVVSTSGGIVVATENKWDPTSEQRGGKYIWVYDPGNKKLFYYAHNSEIEVRPGDLLTPGNAIAQVGRTGANAFKKRSPTHLHFMVLTVDENFYPKPVNWYEELKKMKK